MQIVCIGASAGGLQPIIDILSSIKNKDIDASFVVLQHMASDTKSMMKDILGKKVIFPVEEIKNNLSIKKGVIYIGPPGFIVDIKEGSFNLTDLEPHFPNKVIDHFFKSTTHHWKEGAVGVILSGKGSDGVIGCQNLYENGFTVLVQNPDEAEFRGMPEAVIKSGFYNQTFETKNFNHILEELLQSPKENYDIDLYNQVRANMAEFTKMANDDINLNLESFKLPTLCRRIAKNIQYSDLKSVEDYLQLLRDEPGKRRELFDELMVNVTSFFRDPDFFENLREHLRLVLSSNQPEARFWVCGCSTGEEAYSLAILINEVKSELNECPTSIKIFATDISSLNIQKASKGIYSKESLNGLPDSYLTKYFEPYDKSLYRVNNIIREVIIFSAHDVVSNPPFSRMDLVSCRNLLIYLKQAAQSKALANLVFSLNLDGTLCLGPSESLGVLSKYFKVINSKWRIYTKKQVVQLSLSNTDEMTSFHRSIKLPKGQSMYSKGSPLSVNLSPEIFLDGLIRTHYPDCLILNESYAILAYYGMGQKLLKNNRDGFTSNQFEDLFNENLDLPFMASLIKAKDQDTKIILSGAIKGKEKEKDYNINIEFFDQEPTPPFYILSLTEETNPKSSKPTSKVTTVDLSDSNSIIESLRGEVFYLRNELREQLEEKELVYEELQTSNEEIIASNEELQSANEKLNSINEELYILNNKLQEKMDNVTTSHNDLINIIENSTVGVIFLSPELKVRRTTRNIENIFFIREADVGRNIFELDFGAYLERLKDKLLSGVDIVESYEVLTKENIYYRLEVRPYRVGNSVNRGYVITLSNIDEAKKNEIFLEDTQHDASIGSWILELETGKTRWSREVYNIYEVPFGTPTNLTQGKAAYPKEEQQRLEKSIKGAISGIGFSDTFRFISSSKKLKYVRVTGKPVYDSSEKVTFLRGSIQDITNLHLKEASTQEALAASKTAIFEWFPLNEKMDVDSNWYSIFDTSKGDSVSNLKLWRESVHPEDREEFETSTQYALTNLPGFDLTYRIVTLKGEVKHVQVRFKIIRDDTQDPIRVFGTITDVTRIKSTETQLKEQYKLMAQTTKMAQLGEISAGIGHEINNPLAIALGNHRLIDRVFESIEVTNESDSKVLKKSLKDQKESLIRIKNLVKNLKNFAYTKSHEGQIFDCSETIKDTLDLFKILFNRKEVHLTLDLGPGLTTKGNKERFNQVITNLISNAIDAMEENESPKHITIKGSQKDKTLQISFKDNGQGISQEIQGEIFNQFFTTKEVGKGTGIGLALCRNIVQQMEGDLSLAKDSQEGAEFIVKLPYINPHGISNMHDLSLGKLELKQLSALRGAIIDDEESYVSLLRGEIQEIGPKIDNFTSPLEFLDCLKNGNASNYDFIITDVNMSEMTGFELLEELKSKYGFTQSQLFVISGGMPNFLERKIKRLASEIFTKPVEIFQIARSLLNVPLKTIQKDYSKKEVTEKLIEFFNFVGPRIHISTTLVELTQDGRRPTIYVNKAFTEETGYSLEDVLGKNLKLLQNENSQEEAIEFMRQCFTNKDTCVVDITNQTKEGKEFDNRLVLLPIEIGDALFYLGLQNDISRYKDQEGVILHTDIMSVIHLPLSKVIHELISLFYQDHLKGVVLNEMAQKVTAEVDNINNYILRL